MKYKYTYEEWSQDTKTWEIKSNYQLSEQDVIDIATSTDMDEKKTISNERLCLYV